MDAFERLYAIAVGTGDVCAKAREIITPERLALALSKLALEGTTLHLHPKDVAEALDIPKSTAFDQIDAIGIKKPSSG